MSSKEPLIPQGDLDLMWLMEQPTGRRFMYRLIEEMCGMSAQSFVQNAQIYYLEGRRSVAISLRGELRRLSFENYKLMLAENLTGIVDEPAEDENDAE